MIVFKIIISFGFLTLALGSNNCCGQKRDMVNIAQRKQNADISKPKYPFGLARQQNIAVFNIKTDEAGNKITKVRSTDGDEKADTNKGTPTPQSRPKHENKQNTEKDKSANGNKTKTYATERKMVELTEDELNEEIQNTINSISPEVWELLKKEKKMKQNKNVEEFPECEKDFLMYVGARNPAYSIIFTVMALVMRYIRTLVDKYGLDKSKERELLNQNANSN